MVVPFLYPGTGMSTYRESHIPPEVFRRPRVVEWQEFPVRGTIRSLVMPHHGKESSLAGNGDPVIKTPS